MECSIFSFALDDLMSEIGPRGFHTAFDFHVIKTRSVVATGQETAEETISCERGPRKTKWNLMKFEIITF